MTGDHHSGLAGRATQLARAADEILGTHNLWGRKKVAIPISAVTGVDAGILLNLTKEQVGELPPVAFGMYHDRIVMSPGATGAGFAEAGSGTDSLAALSGLSVLSGLVAGGAGTGSGAVISAARFLRSAI